MSAMPDQLDQDTDVLARGVDAATAVLAVVRIAVRSYG